MESTHRAATVLVVDDEQGPRESLRMILKPTYRVLTAESGVDALAILRGTPVDLVTLDLNMPGIKGESLLALLRGEFPSLEIIVITGYGSVESASAGIRYGIHDYLQKPFDLVKVLGSVTRALSRQRGRRRLVAFLDALGETVGHERDVREILRDLDGSKRLKGQLAQLLAPTDSGLPFAAGDPLRSLEFLEVLSETIESADHFMHGHARRVACYAGLLAARLRLSVEDRERVRISSFLHDVGKVGVPAVLLSRPGHLEPPEQELVREHPVLGARLIEPLGLSPSVAAAVCHHHEWWNGEGYPGGLRGQAIPLAARIIRLADSYDAMGCGRRDRPALPAHAMAQALRERAGREFDPELTKEFLIVVEGGLGAIDLALLDEALAGAPNRLQSAESVEPSL